MGSILYYRKLNSMEIYMAQTINLIGSTQPEVANEIIGNSIIKKLPNGIPYFIINNDELTTTTKD